MGAGGIPSGGVTKKYGRIGDLPRYGVKPNSRIDLYNHNGEKIQSRWYDAKGIAIRNRDYKHSDPGGTHSFPHDHTWVFHGMVVNRHGETVPNVERISNNIDPDFEAFPSKEI